MENKIVGAIFCFMSAVLISARYISAAIFMSGVASWNATLFAAGLEYVGPFLAIAAGIMVVSSISSFFTTIINICKKISQLTFKYQLTLLLFFVK